MSLGILIRRTVLLAPLVLLMGAARQEFLADKSVDEEVGSTEPSLHLDKVSFANAGVISKVMVKPGDHVKLGQVLMEQDPGGEEAELARLKVEAESDLPIKAAVLNEATKAVIYQRKLESQKKGASSDQEVEEAKLEAETAKLQIEKARQDQQQAKFAVDRQSKKLEQMKLLSKTDGVVERVDYHEGEVSVPDPTKPCITLVKNDILWVQVNLPVDKAQKLTIGQMMQVRYPGEKEPIQAKVFYRAPMANPGSNTQLVKMEMENPSGKDSGLPIFVKIVETGKTGAVSAR